METTRSVTIGTVFRKYTFTLALSWMLKHPKTILTVLAVVTLLLGFQLPKLKPHVSMYDFVVEKLPESRAVYKHQRKFGSEEMIRITVKADNIYDPILFKTIGDLAQATERIPGVIRTMSLPQIKNAIESSSPMEMDHFKRTSDSIELSRDLLISADGNTTAIIIAISGNADSELIIDKIKQLNSQKLNFVGTFLTGFPIINQGLNLLNQQRFFIFSCAIFLIMALVLCILLRSITSVVLLFCSIALSIIWTLGIMAVFETYISPFHMAALLFLIAIQSSYGLHALSICTREYQLAKTKSEAVIIGYNKIPLPFILSTATTLLGLLSFLFNPIEAVRDFGKFVFLGMFTFSVLMFSFFPVALSFLSLRTSRYNTANNTKNHWASISDKTIGLKGNHRRLSLAFLSATALICLAGLYHFDIESNPENLFTAKHRILEDEKVIDRNFIASYPVYVTVNASKKGFFSSSNNLKLIENYQEFLEDLPGVVQSFSFADHIKLFNWTANGFRPQSYLIPNEQSQLALLTDDYRKTLGWKNRKAVITSDFSRANIILFAHLADAQTSKQLIKSIQEYANKISFLGLEVSVAGIGPMVSASSHYLTISQIKSLVITFVMIFGILWFILISFKVGLIATVPTLIPIIATFGIISWFHIDFNMFTPLVATISVGLSVGHMIHYINFYNKEFKKDLENDRAMKAAMDRLALPVIHSTIAIAVGSSIMYLSPFKPVSTFGLMMVLTALTVCAATLILLPIVFGKIELVTLWDLLRLRLGKSPNNDSPLFHGLARHQIHSILMAGTLQKLAPREILFNKGDMSNTMYSIVSGSLDIVNHRRFEDATGVHEIQKVVNRLNSGDVVGEMGFFRSTRRSATAIARENTELLQINWQMIRRLQWLYPLTAQKFFINLMGIICDRLENMTNSLCDQSLIDDMTGLFNKKGFTQLLESETNRAQRYQEELALCLIGLDLKEKLSQGNSKVIELMIRTVCQMLSREIRRTDILSRIDTTTFAMVAPKTSPTQANVLCKRLRQVLNRNLLGFGAPSLTVRLAATNLSRSSKETPVDLLERSLSILQSTAE